jgi:hypothetical protein
MQVKYVNDSAFPALVAGILIGVSGAIFWLCVWMLI